MRNTVAFAVGLLLACLAAPAALPAPLEAYVSNRAMYLVRLSLDGRRLAYVANVGGDITVIVKSADDFSKVAEFKLGRRRVANLQWGDADRLVITSFVHDRKEGGSGDVLSVLDLKSLTLTELLQGQTVARRFVHAIPARREPAGGAPALVFLGSAQGQPTFASTLISVGLDGSKPRIVDNHGLGVIQWLSDGQGESRAKLFDTRGDAKDHTWELKLNATGRWTVIATGTEEIPDLISVDDSGGVIMLDHGDFGREASVLRRVGPDGVRTDLLGGAIVTYPLIDRSSGRLYGGVQAVAGRSTSLFLDKLEQTRWNALVKAYEGDEVEWISAATTGERIVVRVSQRGVPPIYALVDYKARSTRIIGDAYNLTPSDLVIPQAVSYPAQDGLRLGGYFLSPRGRAPKNLPLLVLASGGRAATAEMDDVAQGLAAQGYAVFLPSPRGVSGLGTEHMIAGRGEFLDKALTDIGDGVRFLASQGLIDPKRVCIVGVGEVSALTAIGAAIKEPATYRCVAVNNEEFDLRRLYVWEQGTGEPWAFRLGAKSYRDPVLLDQSVFKRVGAIQARVLVVSTYLPPAATGQTPLVRNLQGAKRSYEEVKIEREMQDVVLTGFPDLVKVIADFLIRNNPPD